MNITTIETVDLHLHAEIATSVMPMAVHLCNVGNPDYHQDPDAKLPETACGWAGVASLEEASKLCRKYIDGFDLGGGNWTGGEVRDKLGKVLGRIAYNGAIFPPEARV